MERRKVPVTIYPVEQALATLKLLANTKRISFSQLVREGIDMALQKHGQKGLDLNSTLADVLNATDVGPDWQEHRVLLKFKGRRQEGSIEIANLILAELENANPNPVQPLVAPVP